jgi:hypothetical protein
VYGRIFANPFMGQALAMHSSAPGVSGSAVEAQANTLLGTQVVLQKVSPDARPEGQPSRKRPWNEGLERSVQHLRIMELLHRHGADVNAQALPHLTTPLMMAAHSGNAAVVDLLCRIGADTELIRYVLCGLQALLLGVLACKQHHAGCSKVVRRSGNLPGVQTRCCCCCALAVALSAAGQESRAHGREPNKAHKNQHTTMLGPGGFCCVHLQD